MTKLHYRGVSYDNATHGHPSCAPVEHTYRGQHFEAPLNHDVAPVDPRQELHYRGQVYHHQASAAADQVNQG